MNARTVTRSLKIWSTVAFAVFMMFLAVEPAEKGDFSTQPVNSPSWSQSVAAEFPGCQKQREGDVSDTVVVVTQGSDMKRVSTESAYALNTDDERANDVWVIGVCGDVWRRR